MSSECGLLTLRTSRCLNNDAKTWILSEPFMIFKHSPHLSISLYICDMERDDNVFSF